MVSDRVFTVAVLTLIAPLFASAQESKQSSALNHVTKVGENGLLSAELVYPVDDKPTPQCHASTIVETPSGLVSSWFGGTREKHPDVGIWVSRHVEGSWSKPIEVANGVQSPQLRHPCWNPVLYQLKDGPLLLFYKVGPDPELWWGMLMTSTDDGRTWQSPRKLGRNDQIGHLIGPVKNKPIQLKDGALLCPSSTEYDGWRVHFEISRDLGKSWQVIGPINDGRKLNAIQPSILVHRSGDLQILCRTKEGAVGQSISRDGGTTWSKLTASKVPNPNAGIDALTLADGRHVLVCNYTTRGAQSSATGRNMLHVAVSKDGNSWDPVVTLEFEQITQKGGDLRAARENYEFSYPAIIQSADGKLHITYTYRRQSVKHVTIDPNKIK